MLEGGTLLPLFSAAAALVLLFYLYCYCKAAGKPIVIGKGRLKDELLQSCPILKERYWPTFWAFHCHLNTLLRFFLQKSINIVYKREIMSLMDGGVVALDWGTMTDSRGIVMPNPADQDLPVLLVLPGVSGSSMETYIMHLVQDGLLTGYRPVVFNHRGWGGVPLKTMRIFCTANIDDLMEVIERIRFKYPSSQIVAVGISLGGVNLIQYQHRMGCHSELAAVITSGSIWEPQKSRHNLEETLFNKMVYSKELSKELSEMIISNLGNFSSKELQKLPSLDVKKLGNVKLVSEVHAQVTVPLFGYASLDEYYTDCYCRDKVHKIKTPLVCIAAADDPFVPRNTLPLEEFECNPLTVMVLTSHGGHFGFLEGLYPKGATWLDRTMKQILIVFKKSVLQ